MKARKGKRSEVFWPSTVMKKWLNIKQKVYDFSEDEADTETESEDDDTSCKGYNMIRRHRRGKSETLRAQYINTKEVRVTIGTWNVAGKHPCNDLEIEGWLCTEEPSEIYIIGFQEVVPLNAGNVFGAEDNKPIPKWEEIIRRTLNKSSEPETKQKSYSAPPSPIRTNSFDTQINPLEKEGEKSIIGIEKNFELRKIYDIDLQTILDWPERPLDAIHDVDSTPKLRRVLSSSARIGLNLMDSASLYGYGMKRSHQSSGNLNLLWREKQQEMMPKVFDSLADVSDEENDTFSELLIDKDVNGIGSVKSQPKYVRIVSKQMVGIYVSVWVQRKLRRHVHHLKVSPVGVGLMGYMGNKGSVSVSMSVFQSRMCFVCSHLASGQKDGAEQRRNSDVHEILQRTRFSSVFDTDQPRTIPSHDQIFWFGDLNYRINMSDGEVRKRVALKKWDELMNYDQLSNELCRGHVFEGWKEGLINFPPTYKYEVNSDKYVGEDTQEGEKKRSPAWCDRILWLGKGIKQLKYQSAENQLSDHRPVSSIFLVNVEVIDHRKLQRAINFASAVVHPEIFLEEDRDLAC
ncbi:putative inositol-polyphosphate 5-phosphatase [Medicago truncatula]|uniref:Putative inositol-polyphosphate 5-phosphatase n=1 Tax=Medicago truncatula TaxID=3880 RepID=A0A396IC07_MEDTR|nr:type I inositol polyphosphate 5-phosphatase 2-like isoform X3 [Medicago truncatula]RHN63129.1 putative inositol-polyphosphate 5-phosphatase [Medicago truncatula]